MAPKQTCTGDLRSVAREFNRDKNNRAKWAFGESYGSGRQEDSKARPAKVISNARSSFPGHMKALSAFNKDMADASGDSSADEDIEHPSITPDAEITYSFDAVRGPSHGSQILGSALDRALERFETEEIVKLVKNEYEVLDHEVQILSTRLKGKVAPEDEEYEFVDE